MMTKNLHNIKEKKRLVVYTLIKDIRTHITIKGKIFYTMLIEDKIGLITIYLDPYQFKSDFKNISIKHRLKIAIKPAKYFNKINYKYYIRYKKSRGENSYKLVDYINKGKIK